MNSKIFEGIIGGGIVAIVIGAAYFGSGLNIQAQKPYWGPTQSGVVTSIQLQRIAGFEWVLVSESSRAAALLTLTTVTTCALKVGDTINYKVASDYMNISLVPRIPSCPIYPNS